MIGSCAPATPEVQDHRLRLQSFTCGGTASPTVDPEVITPEHIFEREQSDLRIYGRAWGIIFPSLHIHVFTANRIGELYTTPFCFLGMILLAGLGWALDIPEFVLFEVSAWRRQIGLIYSVHISDQSDENFRHLA